MPNSEFSFILPFLDSLKFEKRYSPLTIRAYHDDLCQFFGYIQIQYGDVKLTDINTSLIRSWLVTLKEEGLTTRSISRKLSALRSFFKYQVRTGMLDAIPMKNILPPRQSKRLPEYVQQEDMKKEVEFADTWDGKTGRLLVNILYNTGMRLSELGGLKEMHVDAGSKTIKVLGKGNKERIIPISPALLSDISTYIQNKARELSSCDQVYLLVNKKGRKLYPKYIYRAVHSCLAQVTTLEKRSPHVLRHSFATHLTNNGADLNSVKELLGHSSLAATQVYTHNTIAKLKDIHKKAHPKS